jgi:hypothetical protein
MVLHQAPKQIYTLADLRLNSIEPAALLSPTDTTLEGVRTKATVAAVAGLTAATVGMHLSAMVVLRNVVAVLAAKTVDQEKARLRPPNRPSATQQKPRAPPGSPHWVRP